MIRFPGVGGVGDGARERVITMPRARRLASTAVVALLAVTGLSACRSAPDVAVYIGNTKAVTEDEVQRIWDDTTAKLVTNPQTGRAVMPITRQDIVNTLAGLDVLGRVVQQRGLSAANVPVEGIAQSLGLSPDATFAADFARYEGLVGAIAAKSQPTQPTPADVRSVYDRLRAAGGLSSDVTFEQFAGGLSQQGRQTLQGSFGMRRDLQPEVEKMNVRANPRYGATEVIVYAEPSQEGRLTTLVGVPLSRSDASAPVTDVA
jgi:hypothetical protein